MQKIVNISVDSTLVESPPLSEREKAIKVLDKAAAEALESVATVKASAPVDQPSPSAQ